MEKFRSENLEKPESLDHQIRDNLEMGLEKNLESSSISGGTGVHADPAELRLFAKQLRDISTEMRNEMLRLRMGLNRLNVTWRDRENAKFVEKLNQSTNPFLKIMVDMEAYSLFLNDKAALLEAFLNQKL